MSNKTKTTRTAKKLVFSRGYYIVERCETADAVEIIETYADLVSYKRHVNVTKLPKAFKANYTDEEWKEIEEKVIKAVCDCIPSVKRQRQILAWQKYGVPLPPREA